MPPLAPHLHPHGVLFHPDVTSRDDLLDRIAATAADLLPEVDAAVLKREMLDREAHLPTSTPEGVAFPHAIGASIPKTAILAVLLKDGVDFGVDDHPPSDLILAMIGSSAEPWAHVKLLARLARLVHTQAARNRIRHATDAADLHARLLEEDRRHG